MPEALLPSNIGQAVFVKTDPDRSKEIQIDLNVPESNTYYLLLEYYNLEENSLPIKVRVEQADKQISEGIFVINHCPYA